LKIKEPKIALKIPSLQEETKNPKIK